MEIVVQVVGRQHPCTLRAAPRDAASATSLHQKVPVVITTAAVAALLASSPPSLAALNVGKVETLGQPAKEAVRAGADAAKDADAAAKGAAQAGIDAAVDADAAAKGVFDDAVKSFQSAAEKFSPGKEIEKAQGSVEAAAGKLKPVSDVRDAVGAAAEKLSPVKDVKGAVEDAAEKLAPEVYTSPPKAALPAAPTPPPGSGI
jgi:hypothetical protein